ncbi:hypothetical protein NX059_006774 [Plenodomus lindquistii]|nr:hypothetical protein NX059_006774 [Plenodomus lindquistii]
MAPPLTVRNLTSTSFSIKRIERFQDPNTLQSKRSGYFFNSNTTSSAFPTSPALGEQSQKFTHQDLDLTLRPFESYTLASQEKDSEQDTLLISSATLRLTLETLSGERYRVDTHPSYTQKSKHTITPLSPSPSASYSALFHPFSPTPHLTIHSNHQTKYATWMADLPDTIPLSALSIPGTHNSHTHYRALPSVRCQHVDIKAQLENGIRFLDIRLQPAHSTDTTKKDLYLVHGAFPVSLTGPKYFEPVLQICYDFLSAHPSETILVSLKREGVGSSTDEHLAHILEKHYITPHASQWYTSPTLPYLGAARGKLVLIRRYNVPSSPPAETMGLDATAWPHNATHALFPPPDTSPGSQFCLQDFCEVMVADVIPEKVQHANDHLVRAAECVHHIPGVNTDSVNPVPPGPLYLNFLSASNFWKKSCWPGSIAKVVNRRMEEWLCEGHHLRDVEVSTREPGDTRGVGEGVRRVKGGDGGTGVVVMDCVGEGGDWELVRLVVGLNMGVLMKASGVEWC